MEVNDNDSLLVNLYNANKESEQLNTLSIPCNLLEDITDLYCKNIVLGDSYDDFDHIFTSELNKHAPKKKKWSRRNSKPHVNKALRQAIIKRSRLKNKANKTKDPSDIKNYKKQRNYVANLNKEAKLEYFSKFESNDNKPFWVNCKAYFTTLQISIIKLKLILCLVKMEN